ncbi:three component ABC system middle component [Novosphingobium sp. BL-52-GroH]|uniref:three component ABC system middle component n=1 Tax=Novosphingobium sp. BL-52-GroH TaxID=3349877 RepID=UPI00384CF098
MKLSSFYNNLGIDAFAISAVLEKAEFLTFPRLMLILPIVAHRDMVRQLANARFQVVSFEQYFIEKTQYFYNFAERYQACLAPTVNALQLLNEIGSVELHADGAAIAAPMPITAATGNRVDRINRASSNIATLIAGSADVFYLNARIEL